MTRQFTSEDADRLLQLGDQFLEDWEQAALESADDGDYAEFQERHDEWTALRPLFKAVPDLLGIVEHVLNTDWKDATHSTAIAARAFVAKAKGEEA